MQESARKWRREAGPATVTPLPRGISTSVRAGIRARENLTRRLPVLDLRTVARSPRWRLLSAPTLAYRCGGSTGIDAGLGACCSGLATTGFSVSRAPSPKSLVPNPQHLTCFPFDPPREVARGHPVPSAGGRRLRVTRSACTLPIVNIGSWRLNPRSAVRQGSGQPQSGSFSRHVRPLRPPPFRAVRK